MRELLTDLGENHRSFLQQLFQQQGLPYIQETQHNHDILAHSQYCAQRRRYRVRQDIS